LPTAIEPGSETPGSPGPDFTRAPDPKSTGVFPRGFRGQANFFGIKRDIPALIMFEYPTIASIIQYLEKNLEDSTAPGQDYEEKNRREKTGRGQNKMRQRRDKLKQIRIE
jgi:hypothetical protein